jgi:hypothetical protein
VRTASGKHAKPRKFLKNVAPWTFETTDCDTKMPRRCRRTIGLITSELFELRKSVTSSLQCYCTSYGTPPSHKSASWLSRLPATNKKFYLFRGHLKEYILIKNTFNDGKFRRIQWGSWMTFLLMDLAAGVADVLFGVSSYCGYRAAAVCRWCITSQCAHLLSLAIIPTLQTDSIMTNVTCKKWVSTYFIVVCIFIYCHASRIELSDRFAG